MKKMLIADISLCFTERLGSLFSDRYEIRACTNGVEALRLIDDFCPDYLVINLSLPYMDGLHVLRKAKMRPPVILAMSSSDTWYVKGELESLGVGFISAIPCIPKYIAERMEDMIDCFENGQGHSEAQRRTRELLRMLGIPLHRKGFQQLCTAIPIFAEDTDQCMNEGLYCAVAKACGNENSDQVERSIRQVIRTAWNNRNVAVWEYFFPGAQKAPSNKIFITALAKKLIEE